MSRFGRLGILSTVLGLTMASSMASSTPFDRPHNSVVVAEDKRHVGEPHTDKGAIVKPYRKKDKLTRKERKKRYGKR